MAGRGQDKTRTEIVHCSIMLGQYIDSMILQNIPCHLLNNRHPVFITLISSSMHRGSRVIVDRFLSRTVKLELQVFKENYDILQVGFQSPDSLAGDLAICQKHY